MSVSCCLAIERWQKCALFTDESPFSSIFCDHCVAVLEQAFESKVHCGSPG